MLNSSLTALSSNRPNVQLNASLQARRALLICFILSAVGGCAVGSNALRYEPDTKMVVEFMAFDLPLPDSAELDLGGTVVAGSGENWSGRIALVDSQTRGELLRFFAETGVEAGWTLRSTTVSDRMTLVLEKDERVASIEIGGSSQAGTVGLFGTGGGSDGRTPVSITVNHKGAVETQRPFSPGAFTLPNVLPESSPTLPLSTPESTSGGL